MAGAIRYRNESDKKCKVCSRIANINFKCKRCDCAYHVTCAVRVKEIKVVAYNSLICPECVTRDELNSVEFFKETCETLSIMVLELHDKNHMLNDNKVLLAEKVASLEEKVQDLRDKILDLMSTHDPPESLTTIKTDNKMREIQTYKEEDWDKDSTISTLDGQQNKFDPRNIGFREVGMFQIAKVMRFVIFGDKRGFRKSSKKSTDTSSDTDIVLSDPDNDGSVDSCRMGRKMGRALFQKLISKNSDTDIAVRDDSDSDNTRRRWGGRKMEHFVGTSLSAAGVFQFFIWIKDKVKDWLILVPPTALAAGAVYTAYLAFCSRARKDGSGRTNKSIQLSNPKVVDTIDVEDISEKAAFCRCWKSKNWPYCDGSHGGHNVFTGDNLGPVIVKKSK